MYDLRAAHWAPCQLLTGYVYRLDTRPPSQIAQEGFQGTQTADHAFAAFEQHTVFSSLSIRGALFFQSVMRSKNVEVPLHLYRINVNGLRGYVFRSRHTGTNAFQNAQQLAEVRFERKRAFFQSYRPYQQMGERRFIYEMGYTLAARFRHGFIPANEVHVQGPVPPARISPYFVYSDEILPAPTAALAPRPRVRRNSI